MATEPIPLSPARLAARVRQRLVMQLEASLPALLDKVQAHFVALTHEIPPTRDLQLLRRDAAMSFQRLKADWLERVRQDLRAGLGRDTKAVTASGRGAQDFDFELVSTDAVENKIVVSRMVMNLMEHRAGPVNDLLKRLKFLNQQQPLSPTDMAQPESLVLCLVESWEGSGLPRDAWPLALPVIQQHLNEVLDKAYRTCNAELIQQGVLPVIEFVTRTRPSPLSGDVPVAQPPAEPVPPVAQQNRRATDQPGGSSNPRGRAPGSRIGAPPAANSRLFGRAQGLLEQVGRLLSGAFLESPPPPGAAGGVSGGGGQMSTGAPASGPMAFTGPSPTYAGPSATLMMALAQQPRLPDVQFVTSEGGGQVLYPVVMAQMASNLRQQSAELKSRAETDNEKAIIELVALMFQSILQEDRIPPGARVWFARLQMPVLRLALEDPNFFNKLDHPARQLIDHMGSCVLGFDASGISTEDLEGEIKRVVQVVEQYPETGDRVYKRVYEEFQQFLKNHLAKKPSAQRVMGVAEQLEQKETLAIQYTIELRDHLKDMPVREEVRTFLFKIWAEVLAVSTVRQGKQHEETLLLKKAATDLIWAASSKPNRADRAKVIAGLSELLRSLRRGMGMLGLGQAEQDEHIKVISDTLADAFMAKTEVIDDAQIQALAQRLAELDDYISDDGGEELPLDTENIEDLLGIDATDLDVVSEGGGAASPVMLAWASDLALGSWFTLDFKGNALQVQYVWRSPLGHMHLFANNVGHSYLFQTPRLAAYLQGGLLEPQEDEPLTARATRSAMDEIQANPARLLN